MKLMDLVTLIQNEDFYTIPEFSVASNAIIRMKLMQVTLEMMKKKME
ncbi:hypothetical protein OROGR_020398 [Orobanche gracilis]